MPRHVNYVPHGVIPAVLLPFDNDLAIDEASFRKHLRDVASVEGPSAITVKAHSTEVGSCSCEEQRRVLDIAQDEIGAKLPLINGIWADLEAARYSADRAFRQYDAIDPQNRLIAAELELRWNSALTRVGEIETRIAAHDASTSEPSLSPVHVAALAADLKAVWSAPPTDARLKKRIVRSVIHEVVADIDDEASEIVLRSPWIGGLHTELRLPRRRRGQRNSISADMLAAIPNWVS